MNYNRPCFNKKPTESIFSDRTLYPNKKKKKFKKKKNPKSHKEIALQYAKKLYKKSVTKAEKERCKAVLAEFMKDW